MLTIFKTLLAFFEMFFGLSLILSSVLVKFVFAKSIISYRKIRANESNLSRIYPSNRIKNKKNFGGFL